ncbi:DNA-deoxyinosine glycosylase [Roseateles sp. DC23W]|uniref:DNA-deoxyinosine glycosylase n=1 Tax=Pelomonas dachongensis TaxID=3299029 RepID=A0ABW7EUB0_9BURK
MKARQSSQPGAALTTPPASAADDIRLTGLAPVFDTQVRVLVLGSFPGVASLEAAQYYAHPRNAFWPVMAALLGEPDLPARAYAQRLQVLLAHHVGVWDAVASCQRDGSLDTAIVDAQPSDLLALLRRLPALRVIACNGALAHKETVALVGDPSLPVLRLPSTSPAHAGRSLVDKIAAWREALAPHL